MTLSPDGYRHRHATVEEVIEAHGRDVEAQQDYRVTDRNYCVDADRGAASRPFEGPNREASLRVHQEAHG